MGKGKRRKPNSVNPAKAKQEREDSYFWVKTERSIDGKTWLLTIEFTEDKAIALSADEVHTYSQAALTACARAEYDAAVIDQLKSRTSEEHAVTTAAGLRADRPPIPAVQGWEFVPGVSLATKKAFVTVTHNGEPQFRVDPDPLRGHVLHVQEVLIVADLDQGYLNLLRGTIGLEEGVAYAVVSDLAVHR